MPDAPRTPAARPIRTERITVRLSPEQVAHLAAIVAREQLRSPGSAVAWLIDQDGRRRKK